MPVLSLQYAQGIRHPLLLELLTWLYASNGADPEQAVVPQLSVQLLLGEDSTQGMPLVQVQGIGGITVPYVVLPEQLCQAYDAAKTALRTELHGEWRRDKAARLVEAW